ncbi:MAG: class I SAM-dependent methyltransferase [Gallionellaceae bacterium]|nr:class I SAM-dependent methyltransferase [Gallionellaceae bacterium]
MSEPTIIWAEDGIEKSALWRSENGVLPPKRVVIADDRINADAAYRLACEGTALLWRGDFQNARQLLQAIARRIDGKRSKSKSTAITPAEAFHLNRKTQAQRAHILGMLLVPFEADHSVSLRRAPDVRAACEQVYGAGTVPYVASLRGLQGLIGAYEWRKNGVEVPALNARIHPHYGVFAPIRGEYVGLVNDTPLPTLVATNSTAFDIGTGTGVLAAVLARRGIKHITATDQDQRALNCAKENIKRLALTSQVDIVQANLFPTGRAALIVCNPPWVPARPSSPLEYAVFDPDSQMLRGFLNGLAEHLEPDGEGWLILSDLAEHLGLRTNAYLIDKSGLKVLGKTEVKPHHPRVSDTSDPLHAARAAELTSLWRLAAK